MHRLRSVRKEFIMSIKRNIAAATSTLRTIIEGTTLETKSSTHNVLARNGGIKKSVTTSTTTIHLPKKEGVTPKIELIKGIIPAVGWENPMEKSIRIRRDEDRIFSRNFDITTLTWEAMKIAPDGRIIQDWSKEWMGQYWKESLEVSFSGLVKEIVLYPSLKSHELWVNPEIQRLIKYIFMPENIKHEKSQEILAWVNEKIRFVNEIAAGLKKNLAQAAKDAEWGPRHEIQVLKQRLDEKKRELSEFREESERDRADEDEHAMALIKDLNNEIAAHNADLEVIQEIVRILGLPDEVHPTDVYGHIRGLMEDHESLLDVREDLADKMDDLKSLREDLAETEELHKARLDEAARLQCQLTEVKKKLSDTENDKADLDAAIFAIGDILGIPNDGYGDDVITTVIEELKKQLGH